MGLVNSLLETSLDEIEIAAEFVDLPNGEYILHVQKAEAKELPATDDKPAGVRVNIIYAVVATVALADSTKVAVDEGALASEGFNLTTQGLPFFKRYLTNIFGDTAGVSMAELIQGLNGMDITAIVKTRESKGRNYTGTSRQAQA